MSYLPALMKFQNTKWRVKELVARRDQIDSTPAFQRGPVWKDPQRQLLIDSILTGYDLPKIYLRELDGNGPHSYEVADGQQRLSAILRFADGQLPLATIAGNKSDLTGSLFSGLPQTLKKRFLSFQLSMSIVQGATTEQIRELFARLQKGSRLTPPELRNSMASTLAAC